MDQNTIAKAIHLTTLHAKSKFIATTIALVVFSLFISLHARAATSSCPSLKSKPLELTKIAKGTYVRKGVHQLFTKENYGAIANLSIIIGKTSIAVIDTGGSYCDGKRFLAAIRKLSEKPISHIIITHSHPDHSFGTGAFTSEKAVIWGHKNLPQAMKQLGPLYLANLQRIMGKEAMQGTKLIAPTKTVTTIETIDLGDRQLKLQSHKTAHTNQDLTVIDTTTNIIWTGDLLFHEHIPVVDGNLLGWQEVMNELSKTKVSVVVPGHGGPRLKWPEALTDQDNYLDVLTSDLRNLIKEGATLREAQNQAAKSEKKRWLLFDEFNARNAAAGFTELEWE